MTQSNPLPRLLDTALLDALTAEARASARGRRNRNLHASEADPCNRLLNAIEPGSYVAPHRHLEPSKDESIVVVRGRLGVVVFDDQGHIVSTAVLSPGGAAFGVDVPHGTWHTVLALEPGTVFFEAKAGPYAPLADAERASWAPAESHEGAMAYVRGLEQLVRERATGS